MDVTPELLQLITEALNKKIFIKPEEVLLNAKESSFTVNRYYVGYSNPLVTQKIDGLSESELRFLKFTPLAETGYLIVQAANAGDEGAIEFHHSSSGKTGTINLRAPLLGFHLEFTGNRNLRLPFGITQTTEAQPRTIGLLRVKQPKRKKATTKKKTAAR